MMRFVLVSVFSLVSMASIAATARAETVGSYSGCKSLGANAGPCNACLRGGQFFNFDKTRKKWVCGNTVDMKPSRPVSKNPPPKPNTTKTRPSSVKKR